MPHVTIRGNWPYGMVAIDAIVTNRAGSSLQVYLNGKLEIDVVVPFPMCVAQVHHISIRSRPKKVRVLIDGVPLRQIGDLKFE